MLSSTGSIDMFIAKIADRVTRIEEGSIPSWSFSLSQNYPNPFNPSTRIEYALPRESHVTLRIFNILGQEVITVVDKQLPAGSHTVEWNGNNYFGSRASNGVYFYRLRATSTANQETFTTLRRMLLLK